MNLDLFIIQEISTVREALEAIEANHFGIIFTSSTKSGEIVGLATDGDIRRKLLQGITLECRISKCTNKDFFWVKSSASREELLKNLDHKIRIIPVLDENKKIVDIITRDYMPIASEQKVYARSRAPVRVSFGGGGSDLTNYFSEEKGAVISATITLYTHVTLIIRNDLLIKIQSKDLSSSLVAKNLKDESFAKNPSFGLIQSILKMVNPSFGFELIIHSDFPMNSGLGGSSSLAVAILGCFNQFRKDQWNSYEISELAFQAERLHCNISGGWQDQYASVFGGFNFIEFNMDQNIVHPLRLNLNVISELEESLVLCFTGLKHNSGHIHSDQKKIAKKKNLRNDIRKSVDLSYQIRNLLLRGELYEFSKLLSESWESKKKYDNKISSKQLDNVYDYALENGALSGKLLGAGGGGFFIFYTLPSNKLGLISALEQFGLKIFNFRFDNQGLQSWLYRESLQGLND
jgi:D-glycero-alpha-D-manno-heptose-7-phosphate kinase